MKYLLKFIFSFLRSSVEVKRGVEFRHSTRNASTKLAESGGECLNTRFPLPTMLCAGYSVQLIYFISKSENRTHNLPYTLSNDSVKKFLSKLFISKLQ